MLVCISHERDVYLLLSEDEKEAIVSTLPSLRLRED